MSFKIIANKSSTWFHLFPSKPLKRVFSKQTNISNGVDMSLPTSNVISLLNDHYNLNYVYSSSGTPTLTTVLNSLSRGKPVYGDFTYSGGAHAVVIRGANFNARTFFVMNPTPTTSGYTSGTVTNSNVWSFICAYSGVTMTLRYYGRYNG